MRISKQAMAIMNSQVNDTFERIASQAFQMARLTKSNALSSRDVTSACRLILPGQLAKHAIDELREKELSALWHYKLAGVFSRCVFAVVPTVVAVGTFSLYVLTGHELTVSRVYTTLALFNV